MNSENIVDRIIPEDISQDTKLQLVLPLFRGEDRFHLHITTDINLEPVLNRLESLDTIGNVERYDGTRLTEVSVRGSVKNQKSILESKNNNCKIITQFSNAYPEIFQTPLTQENVRVHNSSGEYNINTNFSLIAVENSTEKINNFSPLSEFANASKSKRLGYHAYILIGQIDENIFKYNSINNLTQIRKYIKDSNDIKPKLTSEAIELINEYYTSEDIEWENSFNKSIDIEIVSKAYARLNQTEKVTKEMIETVCEQYKIQDVETYDVDMTEDDESVSTTDRESLLLQVIENNKNKGEKGAPKYNIIDTMVNVHEFHEETIEHDLNRLCRKGEKIYELKKDEFDIM